MNNIHVIDVVFYDLYLINVDRLRNRYESQLRVSYKLGNNSLK